MGVKIDALRRDQIEISACLDWSTLKELIFNEVLAQMPPTEPHNSWRWLAKTADSSSKTVKITIRQETEGSPSYNVNRWRADVEIIVNMATGGE